MAGPVLLVSPGVAMRIASGVLALSSTAATGGGGGGGGGGSGGGGSGGAGLTAIPNLVGWWDGGVQPPGGWLAAIFSITDASAAGSNASLSSSNNVYAYPRLNNALGGIGNSRPAYNYSVQSPNMDAAFGVNASVTVGSGGALSIYLVWSRPNLIQGGTTPTTAAAPLLKIGGVTVLDMTGRGDGTDTLRLFPAGAAITGGILTLRHTHYTRVIFSGASVDVWLDGSKVISAAANTLALGATAALSFLSGSECYFHEAAAWSRALVAADHTALTTYAARWTTGARAGANVILMGQSNAGYVAEYAFGTPNKLVAYWTGRLSSNLLTNAQNVTGGGSAAGSSLYSGRGIYGASGDTSNLLTNSGNGDPTTWAGGNCFTQFQTMLSAMSPDLKSNLVAMAWYWSETDSTRAYSEKTLFIGAVRRAWQLIRAQLGLTAAQFPILVISALPFSGSDGGCQMLREVMADLIGDTTQNAWMMLPQSTDAIGMGDTWNAATGAETGSGNGAHRDPTGDTIFCTRMSLPIAQAAIASSAALGLADAVTAFPASITAAGGPRIVSAHYEGTAQAATGSVLVTIAHQNGATDLVVPLQAAIGAGWTVMDGGSPASPGPLVAATACVRVSATTVRITLAQTLAYAGSALLYYPYGQALTAGGYAVIGQGNAVTDNFSTIALPSGWTIGTDIGSSNQPNFPLNTPAYGVPLS